MHERPLYRRVDDRRIGRRDANLATAPIKFHVVLPHEDIPKDPPRFSQIDAEDKKVAAAITSTRSRKGKSKSLPPIEKVTVKVDPQSINHPNVAPSAVKRFATSSVRPARCGDIGSTVALEVVTAMVALSTFISSQSAQHSRSLGQSVA